MQQLNEAIRTIEVKDHVIQVERAKRQRHQSEAQAQKTSFKQLLRFAQGSGNLDLSRLPSVNDELLSPASTRAASARDIRLPTGDMLLTDAAPPGRNMPSPLTATDKGDSLPDVFDDGQASDPGSFSRSPSFRSRIESSTRSFRPHSGKSKTLLIPASELRPVQDPVSQVLHGLHKLMHVCNQPAPTMADPARHVLTVFQRALFADTSVALRNHLQQLSVASDVMIAGLDFGPAAQAIRSAYGAAHQSATTEEVQARLDASPMEEAVRQSHHLTYKVLAKALEAKAQATNYYA
jgi:hypothetical protein